jgi:hypothetical protein
MKSGFLLDMVINQGTTVFELLTGEDEALLIRGDAFLVLDFLLDGFDQVLVFDIESDGLASQSLDEDLHKRVLSVRIPGMPEHKK